MIPRTEDQPAGVVRIEMQRWPWLSVGPLLATVRAIRALIPVVANFLKVRIHITHCVLEALETIDRETDKDFRIDPAMACSIGALALRV